jgi:hypothetical protein
VTENPSRDIHHDRFLQSRRQNIPKPVVRKMIAKPDNIGTVSEESAVVHCSEDTAVFRQSDQSSDREVGLDTGVSRVAARGASIECLRRCSGHSERLGMSLCACWTWFARLTRTRRDESVDIEMVNTADSGKRVRS